MVSALKWVIGFGLVWLMSIPINGILISQTWGWFVVPATGAHEISIAQGIGLSIFLTIVGRLVSTSPDKSIFEGINSPEAIATKGLIVAIVSGVLGPLLVLVIAWIWKILSS